LLGNFVMLVWLAVFASQTGLSQRRANCELSVYGSLKIDVCGNEKSKQFILVMSIGEVKRADSLYGFNYEIQFDNKKVKFTDALYLNTLSEFMDAKTANINNTQGKISGYAVTFGLEPIYANKPLIAFNGLWISDCPDTAQFVINYIEFTDEFKVSIDTLKPAFLIGVVDSTKDRVFKFTVSPDSVWIGENTFEFDASVQVPLNSRLNYFDIEAKYDPNLIMLDSVAVIDSNIEYLISDYNENGAIFKFSVKSDDGKVCNLKFFGKSKNNLDFSTGILFNPTFERECKCVVSSTSDSLIVSRKMATYVNDKENNINDIDFRNSILIYDVMGNLIYKGEKIPDNLSSLSNGVYFVVEYSGMKKMLKKLINVNY